LGLDRTGYRLPTEAEWEYAGRSGTDSYRYYGEATELLAAYVRYQANSAEHAWRCGSLLPNDLGLFDTLGNVSEWCQDHWSASKSRTQEIAQDQISEAASILEKNPRAVRGGTFNNQPSDVWLASRRWYPPSWRGPFSGFRLARTYP
jgi:formylglycine-generating enzyme required for sulfatase activity